MRASRALGSAWLGFFASPGSAGTVRRNLSGKRSKQRGNASEQNPLVLEKASKSLPFGRSPGEVSYWSLLSRLHFTPPRQAM